MQLITKKKTFRRQFAGETPTPEFITRKVTYNLSIYANLAYTGQDIGTTTQTVELISDANVMQCIMEFQHEKDKPEGPTWGEFLPKLREALVGYNPTNPQKFTVYLNASNWSATSALDWSAGHLKLTNLNLTTSPRPDLNWYFEPKSYYVMPDNKPSAVAIHAEERLECPTDLAIDTMFVYVYVGYAATSPIK